jgi:hypothetical protein
LNPLNIDVVLLKQTIIDVINENRIKRNRKLISSDSSLDSVVDYFSRNYTNKSIYKRKQKLKRQFYQISRNYDFFNSWFKTGYALLPALNRNGRAYTLIEEEDAYFFGTKKQIEDSAIVRKKVPPYTYKSYVKNFFYKMRPSKNKRWINNSDVSKIGIKIKIVKDDFPIKVPEIEVLFVISGNVLPHNLK